MLFIAEILETQTALGSDSCGMILIATFLTQMSHVNSFVVLLQRKGSGIYMMEAFLFPFVQSITLLGITSNFEPTAII